MIEEVKEPWIPRKKLDKEKCDKIRKKILDDRRANLCLKIITSRIKTKKFIDAIKEALE